MGSKKRGAQLGEHFAPNQPRTNDGDHERQETVKVGGFEVIMRYAEAPNLAVLSDIKATLFSAHLSDVGG